MDTRKEACCLAGWLGRGGPAGQGDSRPILGRWVRRTSFGIKPSPVSPPPSWPLADDDDGVCA